MCVRQIAAWRTGLRAGVFRPQRHAGQHRCRQQRARHLFGRPRHFRHRLPPARRSTHGRTPAGEPRELLRRAAAAQRIRLSSARCTAGAHHVRCAPAACTASFLARSRRACRTHASRPASCLRRHSASAASATVQQLHREWISRAAACGYLRARRSSHHTSAIAVSQAASSMARSASGFALCAVASGATARTSACVAMRRSCASNVAIVDGSYA